MKNKVPLIIVISSLIFSGLIVFLALNQNNPNPNYNSHAREDLTSEFNEAYPENSPKNKETVEIDLVAEPGQLELIPGEKTEIWNYSGITPSPEIRLEFGDELKINFENQLSEPTTIHFHGIRVPNEMDGVPVMTQDLIEPGENFTYQFTPKDPGTYWFHPHNESAEQMEMGLYGVIVVEDEISEKYTSDEVWVIDDWLLMEDYQIYPDFVTPHDLMHDGRWGNVITVNSNLEEELKVQPGERVRLRLVNTSNARVYQLDFGKLDAKAIAVDGLYVKEVFDPQGFELAPGNRIDLDIKIPSDASGKEFPIYDYFTDNKYPLAKIVVEGEEVETPDFDYPVNSKIPDWAGAINAEIDQEYILDSERNGNGMGMMDTINWTLNGEIYPDSSVLVLNEGEFNKISFVNESYRLHPMHLHGQFFKVISRDGEAVDEPFFRDTVLVHPKETVEIGLVPLDKGSWANHCHILEHAESGMMTEVLVQ